MEESNNVNVLFDIEYIDTISNEVSLAQIDKFDQIKTHLDGLRKSKLITIDEWYNALIFVREKLKLPYVKWLY